jgi:hypothetical protein
MPRTFTIRFGKDPESQAAAGVIVNAMRSNFREREREEDLEVARLREYDYRKVCGHCGEMPPVIDRFDHTTGEPVGLQLQPRRRCPKCGKLVCYHCRHAHPERGCSGSGES